MRFDNAPQITKSRIDFIIYVYNTRLQSFATLKRRIWLSSNRCPRVDGQGLREVPPGLTDTPDLQIKAGCGKNRRVALRAQVQCLIDRTLSVLPLLPGKQVLCPFRQCMRLDALRIDYIRDVPAADGLGKFCRRLEAHLRRRMRRLQQHLLLPTWQRLGHKIVC